MNGFWENETSIGHVHDVKLCNSIVKFLKENDIKSIVDFGCGMGDYAKQFIINNIECEAYDGNPNTETLTNGLGRVIDLSKEFDLKKRFDCVLSLEVGEHIPKEYEQVFINNIVKHTTNLLILSWAIIGQGGDGHVNCQNNDYIISEMDKRGFYYDINSSKNLRSSVGNALWFINTIMVFRKK
jgi:cyclopropane fatty-acyl-phospholipid synthase-like methyltransferase